MARRVEMPISMWGEVLELCKTGGIDYRDALVQLLDLGLQAQSEDRFKPRLISIDHKVWERVAAAKLKGATDGEALLYLVDLGLQSRAAEMSGSVVVPPEGSRVLVDLIGPRGGLKRLAEVFMPSPPAKGDVVTIKGEAYEVLQRAWSLTRTNQTAYLRVRRYGEEA